MEIPRGLDLGTARRAAALDGQLPFGRQQAAQAFDFLRADLRGGRAQEAGLYQPAGGEDLAGFLRRGMGDEGAAVLLDAD
ncbi:hypothetical protein D3C72_2222210 [compost metagenome]